ncbi:vesicle transport through interaction with t-SNAREs homolog 1B [Anoplophora glabripennis]|uniref:vesicle transport through interaction with t-SNAREs homolog 1B n=1 Tax=Anoplophora glabripennis TaxID=217634 RepID=UPI0008737E2A|nr:vesicle transport through interaction with t-SNAREs homolog 1B [Anoplophora glabripennis]
MSGGPDFDWEAHNRQVILEGTAVLERTGDSIARSNQIAIETENIGNEVINELGEQREALLRTRDRLENANEQLLNTKSILNKMRRNVVYNKFILIMIIIIEIIILLSLSYLKFIKK